MSYISNGWNYWDFSGCVLFLIGILLRTAAVSSVTIGNNCTFEYDDSNETSYSRTCLDLVIASRIFLASDFMVWTIRFLHIFLIFHRLGPKLIMLKKMLIDLFFFMGIILIFVLSHGVISYVSN